jgi:hypothetical protein
MLKNRDFNLLSMSKVRRVSKFQHKFSFLNASENYQLYFHRFLLSDLRKIYSFIPWDALVLSFKLKESVKGTKNYVSPKGKIALIF